MHIPDLLHRLGDLPLERLVMPPAPAMATMADVIAAWKPAHELVEGTLVNRPADFLVACTTPFIGARLYPASREGNHGIVTNALGPVEILPGLVRVPDVAYTPWSRLPNRCIPEEPIPAVVPEYG
jgi:hypothetical protein